MTSIQPGSTLPPNSNRNPVATAQQQISSGKRINSAADDAAGLAITSRISSDISGKQQAQRNAINAQSLIQSEDGALQSISNGLQRLQQLAIQQGNGILNDSDRQAINGEAQQITDQIRQITEQSQFNGRPLFPSVSDAEPQTFQVGEDSGDTLSIDANTLADNLNQTLSALDFSQPVQEESLNTLATLQTSVVDRRTELGAVSNRLDAGVANLGEQQENSQAARSRIEDADLAKAVSEMIKGQIQQQAQISARLQANASAENVLQLLS